MNKLVTAMVLMVFGAAAALYFTGNLVIGAGGEAQNFSAPMDVWQEPVRIQVQDVQVQDVQVQQTPIEDVQDVQDVQDVVVVRTADEALATVEAGRAVVDVVVDNTQQLTITANGILYDGSEYTLDFITACATAGDRGVRESPRCPRNSKQIIEQLGLGR